MRIEAAEVHGAVEPEPRDLLLELLLPGSAAEDLQPRIRHLGDHLGEDGDRVRQALLRRQARRDGHQAGVPLDGCGGRLRHLDGIRDDEEVARPASPLRDVIALAPGERDHRVHAVDPPQDAPVHPVHVRVPLPGRLDVEVVHRVDEMDAPGLDRHDERDEEARVHEHEAALAPWHHVAEPAAEPGPDAVELADDGSGGGDLLDRAAPRRSDRDLEVGDAQERGAVGAQVVEDDLIGARPPIADPPRAPVGAGLLADARGAEVGRRGAGHLLVLAPTMGPVVVVDVQQTDRLRKQAPVHEQLPPPVVVALGLERQHVRPDPAVAGQDAVAHQQGARLAARIRPHRERARQVPARRQRGAVGVSVLRLWAGPVVGGHRASARAR